MEVSNISSSKLTGPAIKKWTPMVPKKEQYLVISPCFGMILDQNKLIGPEFEAKGLFG